LNFELDFLSSLLFAPALCVSSVILVAWHTRAWKRLQDAEIDSRERDFRCRQYRRRMQTSVMLGVVGVAICIGQFLMRGVDSRVVLVTYWSGVLLLVFWLVLLAAADMVATSFYYSREKTEYIVDHAKLRGELQRLREEEAPVRNGKPK
jgi:hypothetical protein